MNEYHYDLDRPGDYERLSAIAESGSDEYWARIKARLPIRYPRYRVGDVVVNPISGQPAPVVRVSWDPGSPRSFWRVSIPGYSGEDFFATPREGTGHRMVEMSSSSWAEAHRLEVYCNHGRPEHVRTPCERVVVVIPTTDDASRPWQRGRRATTLTPPIY